MPLPAALRPLLCAALVGSSFLAAATLPPVTASAAPLTVTCGGLLGSQTSQAFAYCAGPGAVPADAGASPTRGVLMTSTGTIHWSNGRTAEISYTLVDHTGSANTCVEVKTFTKDLMETESGRVVAHGTTATGMIGGAVDATICVYKKAGTTVLLLLNQGRFTL